MNLELVLKKSLKLGGVLQEKITGKGGFPEFKIHLNAKYNPDSKDALGIVNDFDIYKSHGFINIL